MTLANTHSSVRYLLLSTSKVMLASHSQRDKLKVLMTSMRSRHRLDLQGLRYCWCVSQSLKSRAISQRIVKYGYQSMINPTAALSRYQHFIGQLNVLCGGPLVKVAMSQTLVSDDPRLKWAVLLCNEARNAHLTGKSSVTKAVAMRPMWPEEVCQNEVSL